jgi:hypothetical protein
MYTAMIMRIMSLVKSGRRKTQDRVRARLNCGKVGAIVESFVKW